MGDEDTVRDTSALEAYIEKLHIAIYGFEVDKKHESELPPEPAQLPDDQQTLASVTNLIEYYLKHPNKKLNLLGDLVKKEENTRSEAIDGAKWIYLRLNDHGFGKKIRKLKEIGFLEQNYSPTFSKVSAESLNGLIKKWNDLVWYIQSDGMNRIGKLNYHSYSARHDKFISSYAADMTSGVEESPEHRYASNKKFDEAKNVNLRGEVLKEASLWHTAKSLWHTTKNNEIITQLNWAVPMKNRNYLLILPFDNQKSWKWIRVAKTFKSDIRNFVKFALILMFLSPFAAAGYDPEGDRSPAAFLLGDFQPVVEETVHLPVMGHGCEIILTISAKPISFDSNLKMDKLGYVFFKFKHPNFEDECHVPLMLQNDVFMPKECTICFSSCKNVSKDPFTIVASYNKAVGIDVKVETREGRNDCEPENTSDTSSDAWLIPAIIFGVLALVLLLLLAALILVLLFKQYKKTRRSGTQIINDSGHGGFDHQPDDGTPMVETQDNTL